jgi:hypothetical protein
MSLLTIKEVSAELRVSQQWLKYWLVENPVDESEVPFYVRTGNRLKFERGDVERILAHMRRLESTRLGMSGKSKVRLVGLMSKIGSASYEDVRRSLDEAKRKKEEERAKRPPQRRVRLPRAPRRPKVHDAQ